ncbi:MAG: hypothetical protein HYV00_12740 [Deltaproteobacteria bacterium]|nr:hypothetical protein [Deltaproteobacteria bacterium]MBI3059947.1 hypothetical protein [Deltaproteobacteria bacterium]
MAGREQNQEPTERRDLFHQGIISKLFPSNNMGLVRTESGREVPFSFEFVVLLGEAKKPADLSEGQEVGYDLGWTSKGLRVTTIKAYPAPTPAAGDPSSEGEGSQGQDLPS